MNAAKLKLIAILAALPLLGAKCDINPVASAGKSVGEGLGKIGDGIKQLQIDPVGTNKLLNENAEYRKQVSELMKQFGSLTGTGYVDLQKRNLLIRVGKGVGSFRLTGGVDTDKNLFWKNLVQTYTTPDIAADYVAFIRALDHKYSSGGGRNGQIVQAESQLVQKAQEYVNNAAMGLLSKPATSVADHSLQYSVLGPGNHNVFVDVTPINADTSGNWSIEIALYAVDAQGNNELIKTYQLDKATNPNHKMGTALPTENLFIKVGTN